MEKPGSSDTHPAVVTPLHAFGSYCKFSNSVGCIDAETFCFHVGQHLVVYNRKENSQRFVQLADKVKIVTAMAFSPSRKYVAVAEKMVDNSEAQIDIISISSCRKIRTLTVGDTASKEVVSMAFSGDSRYLVVQGGAPDFTLFYWNWDKNKVLADVRQDHTVFSVSVNPADNAQIMVAGRQYLKLYRMVENSLKGFNPVGVKKPVETFGEHIWLSDDRCLVATDTGDILIFDQGEPGTYLEDVFGDKIAVTAMHSLGTGFLVGSSSGHFAVFELTDPGAAGSGDAAAAAPKLSIKDSDSGPEGPVTRLFSPCLEYRCAYMATVPRVGVVRTIATSPGDEIAAIALDNSQMYTFPLLHLGSIKDKADAQRKADDLALEKEAAALEAGEGAGEGGKEEEAAEAAGPLINPPPSAGDADAVDFHNPFSYLMAGLHDGKINDVDVCLRTPLVATCGSDRFVRVWDYQKRTLVVEKTYNAETGCVAIHPCGMLMLAGFSDRLRLLQILANDLVVCAEFPVRNCTQFRLYKGHAGQIRDFCWSDDDNYIVSVASDGATYTWGIESGERVGEHVVTNCNYDSVVCSVEKIEKEDAESDRDASSAASQGAEKTREYSLDGDEDSDKETLVALACGKDGKLREIARGEVLHEYQIVHARLVSLVLQTGKKYAFAGTHRGAIRCYNWPVRTTLCFERLIHRGSIVGMHTPHAGILVSAAEDGSLYIMGVHEIDPATEEPLPRPELPPEETWDVVHLTKGDVEDLEGRVVDLATKIQELQSEHIYQLSNINQQHKNVVDRLNKEKEELANVKSKELGLINGQVSSLREAAELALKKARRERESASEEFELEKMNLQQQRMELEKKFEEERADMKFMHELKIRKMEEDYQGETDYIKKKAEDKQTDLKGIIEIADGDIVMVKKDLEEQMRQQEKEFEDDLEEEKAKSRRLIQEEKDKAIRLRGEALIMRKRFDEFREKISHNKVVLAERDTQIKNLQSDIKLHENNTRMLKLELNERDDAIAHKERRILELKHKNQQLDKFKFVLDHKIKELKGQLEPRDELISDIRSQIADMDAELNADQLKRSKLELTLEEKEKRLASVTEELRRARGLLIDKERFTGLLTQDLYNIVTRCDPDKWSEELRRIHRRYLVPVIEKPRDTVDKQRIEREVIAEQKNRNAEFSRQREYLEHAVTSLKGHLTREKTRGSTGMQKKLFENADLISEINELRKEKRQHIQRISALEDKLRDARAAGAAAKRALSESQMMSESAVDDSVAPSPAPGAAYGGRPASVAGMRRPPSRGRVIKGSTRGWSEVTSERGRLTTMLVQLEQKDREMEVQKRENARLQQALAMSLQEKGAVPAPAKKDGPKRSVVGGTSYTDFRRHTSGGPAAVGSVRKNVAKSTASMTRRGRLPKVVTRTQTGPR